MEYTEKQVEMWKAKAEKWDALDTKIASFYVDEEGEPLPDDAEIGLMQIGEAAAEAFGFL